MPLPPTDLKPAIELRSQKELQIDFYKSIKKLVHSYNYKLTLCAVVGVLEIVKKELIDNNNE